MLPSEFILIQYYLRIYNSPWWCKCEDGSPHGDPACFPENPKEIVFIPQVRGIPGQGRHPNDTYPDVGDQYDTVLAYNEPNQPDQADISPEDAAFHYAELAEKYKEKVYIHIICLLFSSKYSL